MSFFIRLRETFAVPTLFRERVALRWHRFALDNTWQQSRSVFKLKDETTVWQVYVNLIRTDDGGWLGWKVCKCIGRGELKARQEVFKVCWIWFYFEIGRLGDFSADSKKSSKKLNLCKWNNVDTFQIFFSLAFHNHSIRIIKNVR